MEHVVLYSPDIYQILMEKYLLLVRWVSLVCAQLNKFKVAIFLLKFDSKLRGSNIFFMSASYS